MQIQDLSFFIEVFIQSCKADRADGFPNRQDDLIDTTSKMKKQLSSTQPLLADLVDMKSPGAVFDEVSFIATLIAPQMDPSTLTNAFSFTASLYHGLWPSERACNTNFHDLRHITDTLLAMVRLIHGAIISGHRITPRNAFVGCVAAMAHDAGYIQDIKDGIGTGAKYTAVHVRRSIEHIERYGKRYGLNTSEIGPCQQIIQCTDMQIDPSGVVFQSKAFRTLGKILAVADLIGQLADRIYLEKLFYLYREFEEGRVDGYYDEMDMLKKSLTFFDTAEDRISKQLDGLDRFAAVHFRARWDISRNLYRDAIEKHRRYLAYILSQQDCDPSQLLRRNKILQNFKKEPPSKD